MEKSEVTTPYYNNAIGYMLSQLYAFDFKVL